MDARQALEEPCRDFVGVSNMAGSDWCGGGRAGRVLDWMSKTHEATGNVALMRRAAPAEGGWVEGEGDVTAE